MKSGQAFLLALGMILAAFVFGLFFYNARVTDHTVTVVGSATQRFTSDMIKWRLAVSRSVGAEGLKDGYESIQKDVEMVTRMLNDAGIADNEISVQAVTTYPRYDRNGELVGQNIQQGLFVFSPHLDQIEQLALNPSSLIESGVVIQESRLEYFSSTIADLKRELLAEATRDARLRAREIASGGDKSVGQAVSLRAGVFQIREPYSTEVSAYGMYNTQTREKDITVTVHATFVLR